MPIDNYPSIAYVRQCLREDNGHLFWLERPREHFKTAARWKSWNVRYPGTEAGTIMWTGYDSRCVVTINYQPIYRASIVWALHTGEWRIGLDHEKRNTLDDRFEKLRIVTPSQNAANSKTRSNNKSGFKGVSFHKRTGRWISFIRSNSKHLYLGLFDTPEEAHAAYMEAAKEHFGEFASDGKP